MGRKIPAKKHRGVKNPLEQQARREKILKCKINAPPKDPDEQPIPRSLTRLFAFQDKSKRQDKSRKPIKKQNRSSRSEQKSSEVKNPVSRLKRLPGESGRSFSLRINSAMRALHDDTSDRGLAAAYLEDMEAEDVKGERMAEQRARRQRKRRAERARAGGEAPAVSPCLQRRALKAQAKQDKVEEAARERAEVQYERVQFGEVAHAPPALRLVARGAGAPRPGRRDLLLSPLLAGDADARRDQARLELARRDAIAAYRALTARRRDNKHT